MYNLISGIVLTVLAGAMFTVSATAVGVLVDVPMPGLNDWLPTSWMWIAVVAAIGVVTSFTAAFGYGVVSRFALIVTPYMVAVILYFGVKSLWLLDVRSPSDLWTVANEKVWTGRTHGGYSQYGFWQCMLSAWFCDLMLHIGQLDLTILRYGKTANVGWCSAAGMFVGHYLTWIIAALLYAVQLSKDPQNESVAPGPMAQAVGGINGLLCVIVAGWSTANPIMYAAGLAFQALLGPKWSTWTVTLGVGAAAICAGIFPALVMMVLELLAFGGLVLMPMGVVIFADCFMLPMLGLDDEYCERERHASRKVDTNWPAAASWTASLALTLPLVLTGTLEVFYAPLLGIPLVAAVYVGGSYVRDRVFEVQKDIAGSCGA